MKSGMRRYSTRIASVSFAFVLGLVLVAGDPTFVSALDSTALKWTTQTAAGSGGWRSVTWSPELGRFVAVGRQSSFPFATIARIMTSTDGKSWDLVGSPGVGSVPNLGVWNSVTWSPELGLFVAVACNVINTGVCGTGGDTLRVITSPDGYAWTARSTPDTSSTWQSIIWSPELDLFVAVADGGSNSIMTSPDGITWTARTAPEDNTWKSVTWSADLSLFVAVAGSGTNRVMTSPDGINWTARTAAEANTWNSVTWSPELNKFVAVAQDGTNRVMTSGNGTVWTAHSAAAANAWASISWSPELGRFAAVANAGTNRVMTSSDGETWTAQSASVDNAWNGITWSPALGTFMAVASSGTNTTRAMTGSLITASTNDATNVAARGATLHGGYLDDFPGANVFFRYRIAGSSDPFTETTPQAVTAQGAFNATVTNLTPGTEYEFTAVIQWPGASGTQTLESGLETFTTLLADDDNDGIYNVIEDAAPNGGDVNSDGMLDSAQPFVASFVNTVTNEYAALELDNVCQIDTAEVRVESQNTAADPAFEYPVGMMNFQADCGTAGYTAQTSLYFFGADDGLTLRKYTPNAGYFTVDGAAVESVMVASMSGVKATSTITDGSNMDADGAADGIITDPAGLALPVENTNSSGGAGANGTGLASTGQNFLTYAASAILMGIVSISVLISRRKQRP